MATALQQRLKARGGSSTASVVKQVTNPKVGDKVVSAMGAIYQLTRQSGSNWVGRVVGFTPGSQAEAEGIEIGNFLNVDLDTAKPMKLLLGDVQKGSFFQAVAKKQYNEIQKFYSPQEKAAMNENSGLQGGYLVPQDYTLALYKSLAEHSILWPRAFVWPMTTLECLCPRPNVETAQSAGTAPYFGGMLFTWGPASQGDNLTETEPINNQLSLKANDLTGYLVTSNQLWGDIGPAGEEAIINLCGAAAAWYSEYAFFNGTGASNKQPMGIINASATKLVTRNAANHISQVDVATMASFMIPYGWLSAIWICSPSTLLDLVSISGYTPNEAVGMGEPSHIGTLYGRPVFITDKLPALGTKGDLIFIDPSLYAIGDRQQAMIDISDQYLFNTYQTVLRVTMRVDGRPVLDGAITLADGTTTASAYVVLN